MTRALKLKCESCGHEWRGRNTEGKARQCSKCRSRRIIEIEEGERLTAKSVGTSMETPIDRMTDDADIKAKIKELQLARLDRQIAEAKGYLIDQVALGRTVEQLKETLRAFTDDDFEDEGRKSYMKYLASLCPWCGVESMSRTKIGSKSRAWKCERCGRVCEE
jgi:predicted Zn-ribbon and HTH transcriptional regulator